MMSFCRFGFRLSVPSDVPRRRPSGKVALITVSLLVLGGGLIGCSRPEPIRRYTIPKPPHGMLAAMLTSGSDAWFFKVSGARPAVAAQREAFETFLKSVQLEAGATQPTWQLPAGWQERPASGERVATIAISGTDPPLELTVTRLPLPGQSLDDYKLQNINRWRQQIRLGPLTSRQLPQESRELTTATGAKVTWVDLVGTLAPPRKNPGGMARMGAGGRGADMGMGTGFPDEAAAAPEELPFEHTAPAGWRIGPPKPLRKLTYLVGEQGESGEVTVISLPADANDLLSNINRWREQVGLPPVTAPQLASTARTLSLGGVSGTYVELIGTGEAPTREAILGVMAVRGSEAWFFKFKGPAALVDREKANFEAFVGSVRFKGE